MSTIALPHEDTHPTFLRLEKRLPDRPPIRSKPQPRLTRNLSALSTQDSALSPSPSALSPRKLAANRRNAAKSTGPRTPAGKARSSQNATTHGLTSKTLPPILDHDNNFQRSLAEFTDEFRPNSPAQHTLVHELAYIGWKLYQFPQLERALLQEAAQSAANAETPNSPTTDNGQLTTDPNPQSEIRNPQSLSTQHSALSTAFYSLPVDQRLQAYDNEITLLAQQFLDTPTPLTRIWDCHRRLLARFQSICRQLHTLKTRANAIYHEDAKREAEFERVRRGREIDAQLDALEIARHQEQQRAQAEQTRPAPHRATSPAPAQNEPTESFPHLTTDNGQPTNPQYEIPNPQCDPPAQNEPTDPAQNEPADPRQLTTDN